MNNPVKPNHSIKLHQQNSHSLWEDKKHKVLRFKDYLCSHWLFHWSQKHLTADFAVFVVCFDFWFSESGSHYIARMACNYAAQAGLKITMILLSFVSAGFYGCTTTPGWQLAFWWVTQTPCSLCTVESLLSGMRVGMLLFCTITTTMDLVPILKTYFLNTVICFFFVDLHSVANDPVR